MPDRFYVALDRGLASAAGFLTAYGAAAILDSEVFGMFVIYEAVRVGILMCTDRPVGQAHVHRAAAAPEAADAIVGATLLIKAAILVCVTAISLAVASLFALSGTWAVLAWSLPMWVALSMLHTTAQQLLNAGRRFAAMSLLDGLMLAGIATALWLGSSAITQAAHMMWLTALCRAGSALCLVVVLDRPNFRAARAQVAGALRFARAAFVNNVASFLNLRSDAVLLGLLAGIGDAARWGLVAPMVNAYMLIGEAANLELLPQVSREAGRGDHDGVRRSAWYALCVWGGAGLVLSAVVICLPIERLLPGDLSLRSGAKGLFILMAVAGPLMVFARVFAAVNNGYGSPGRNAYASIVGLVVKLTIGAAAISLWGAQGSGVAMIATSAVVLIFTARSAAALSRRRPVLSTPATA